mmetsp:Transcript_5140/g.13090  ORF Transcript_5140/g.13090 Transcript_5140/m.13090 type:complete len:289 (-) Transcript_5140:168-1034(-)
MKVEPLDTNEHTLGSITAPPPPPAVAPKPPPLPVVAERPHRRPEVEPPPADAAAACAAAAAAANSKSASSSRSESSSSSSINPMPDAARSRLRATAAAAAAIASSVSASPKPPTPPSPSVRSRSANRLVDSSRARVPGDRLRCNSPRLASTDAAAAAAAAVIAAVDRLTTLPLALMLMLLLLASKTRAYTTRMTPLTFACTTAILPPTTSPHIVRFSCGAVKESTHGDAIPRGPLPGFTPLIPVGTGCMLGEGLSSRSVALSSATKYASKPTAGSRQVTNARTSRVSE